MASDDGTARTVSSYPHITVPRVTNDAAVTDPPPVPVLVVDDDETKRFALKELLSPWRVIVDAEQASRLVVGSGAEDARRAEVCHRIEIRVPGSDPKIVLLTSNLIPDGDGGIAGWVGTLADVTAVAREQPAAT